MCPQLLSNSFARTWPTQASPVAVLDFKNWGGQEWGNPKKCEDFFYSLQLLYHIMYTSYIISIIYFTKAD